MAMDEAFGPDLVTLVDDEGQEHEFEMVDTLEYNGMNYVALVATHDDPEGVLEDDGELMILRVCEAQADDEDDFLEAIEDEEEFDEIAGIFMERLSDSFEFTDEDEEYEDEDEE